MAKSKHGIRGALANIQPQQTIIDFWQSLGWLRHYQRRDLPGDIIAGLTVAVMLVPQSMAYALLAGLPPIVGLYASIVPVLIYGLLGSTGIMTLGPTAITSVMTLSTISTLAGGDVGTMMLLAASLSLLIGIVYFLMALLRLGFIVNLLSQPVIIGYVNAAAIIIGVSQISNLLGVSTERSSYPHIILWRTLREIPSTNLVTLLLGIGGIATLLFFKYRLDGILKRIGLGSTMRFIMTRSGALFITLIGTAIVFAFNLDTTMGVRVVGDIPQGLPSLNTQFDLTMLQPLLLGAIAIAFVGLMEDISTANSLISTRNQKVNANQEMLAMGAANIASAFTGGFPVTTSISRSAVNHSAGGRTGLSSMIAAVMLAITVMFLTPLFYYLPQAILAAIIMTSIFNLLTPKQFMNLWHASQAETSIALVTILGVFLVSIELGILLGVALMILLYVYRSSRPEIVELGRRGYTTHYDLITDEETMPIPNTMIVQVHESLYFANSQYLDQYIRNTIAEADDDLEYLILDCSAINSIDISSIQTLSGLVKDLQKLDIRVMFAGLKEAHFTQVRASQLKTLIGNEHFYPTTHDAVVATGQLIDDMLPI